MTEAPNPTPELKPCPRLAEEDIKEIALGLVKGRYFTANMCPPDMITSIFMVVGLGGLSHLDPDTIGNIIEDLDKAGERSINGYPIFFSCGVIHKEDWAQIAERATKIQGAIEEATK